MYLCGEGFLVKHSFIANVCEDIGDFFENSLFNIET